MLSLENMCNQSYLLQLVFTENCKIAHIYIIFQKEIVKLDTFTSDLFFFTE